MGGSLIRSNQEFQFVHIGQAEIVLWEELVATMVIGFFTVSVGGSFLEFLRYKHTDPYLGLKAINALEMVNRFTGVDMHRDKLDHEIDGEIKGKFVMENHRILIGYLSSPNNIKMQFRSF